MRITVAALLAAIVLFVWQFVSHTFLPIGEMGFRTPQNEDVVLQAVATNLSEPGIYALPYIDPTKMQDAAVVNAWVAKEKTHPFTFVVTAPPDPNAGSMVRQLAIQFISSFVAALLAAWLLANTTWSFVPRVIGAAAIGVFGWLANAIPQWNWYRFPTDFAVGTLLDQGIGWLLAGVAMAWWLGRGRPVSVAGGPGLRSR